MSIVFSGRKLIIATKHKKEQVIGPIVEKGLGVTSFVNDEFDTDILGTFTGEIERKLDPIETVRQKCLMAMEKANCDLGIANEGSFGSHPSVFFANADDEFVIFIDKENNLEIIARELSLNTNFNGREITNENELLSFANSVNFPSHALILRKSKYENTEIVKGINDINQLKAAFSFLSQVNEKVYVETDMRAMYNPTRMKVIELATIKLIDKINSLCPNCNKPGFSVTDTRKGLKCSLCGLPTNSTLSYISVCQHCSYQKEDMFPNNKTTEEPMYCNYCNP
ncbi:MAG: DUF6671 family protein [Chitinophagaceae bacterium]